MVPKLLYELVSIRKSSRKRTSSGQILLQVPVSRLKSYGDVAFNVAAPTSCNRSPADIRSLSQINSKYLLNILQTYYLGYYYITYYLDSVFEWLLLVRVLY